jgi:hypothetical protein
MLVINNNSFLLSECLPTAVTYYRIAHKIIIIIIQFIIYLRANLTTQRPIINLAQVRRKKQRNTYKKDKIIIQFNSILYYLCAESTATRPITDTAQIIIIIIIIIIMMILLTEIYVAIEK